MTEFNLFVYGTLRRGGAAERMLDGCRHLGAGTVDGMLYDIGGRFPALLSYGGGRVNGEIWRCPADLLLALDRYEGVADGLFRRIGLDVDTPDGPTVPCWTYTAGPALARQLTPDRRIASGEWPVPTPTD